MPATTIEYCRRQYSICGKTRGGQQCILTVFTKPVRVNENLRVERHQRGVYPQPPTNRALHVSEMSMIVYLMRVNEIITMSGEVPVTCLSYEI